MTDHHTLEPIAAVRIRAGEPEGAAAVAAVADLVCADDELLRAEFDAIIAANFPGAAEHGHPLGPETTVMARTERVVPHRWPTPSDRRPGRASPTAAQKQRARQRGPPGDPGRPSRDRPSPDKDVDRRTTNRRWLIDRHNPSAACAASGTRSPGTGRPRATPGT